MIRYGLVRSRVVVWCGAVRYTVRYTLRYTVRYIVVWCDLV